MPFKLLALVLPLSLDTFAVSAALGLAGLPARDRWRLSLVMCGFEAVMPIIGVAGGALVGRAMGEVADYVAAAVLIGAGAMMLRGGDDDPETLRRPVRGLAMIGIGLSVSMDELAIGLAIGLLRLPVVLVALLIGAQALLVSQFGVLVGARLGAGLREGAERAAGVLLVVLGAGLAVLRLTGHPV